MSKELNDLKRLIKQAKRVLISTHSLPDGDGLGAETALYHYLRSAKKSCRVCNPDRTPKRYQFLDPERKFLLAPPKANVWDKFDLWIIVDTNDPRRLNRLWGELSFRAKNIVFLDHHPETEGVGVSELPPHAFVVSDTSSSSIGELLHHLFGQLKLAKIDPSIALGLYVSVMTDTNSFRYARTTPQSHRIAADTIELGVNPEDVYQDIYSSKQVSHVQLLGSLLQNVQVAGRGRLAWISMDRQLRQKHRASADDTQSFLNLLLVLKDAEVVCLFREEDDHRVRVSIKSKGRVVINRVAMEFGGGGHDYAAGMAFSATLKEAIKVVTKRLIEAMDDQG